MGEPDVLLALPSKGRLRDVVDAIFRGIGILPSVADDRRLIIKSEWRGVKIIRVRTEDIPYLVASGRVTIGVTGHDYVVESGVDVEEVLDIGVGRAKLVVAVPKHSGIGKLHELEGATIATKYVRIAEDYFRNRGIRVSIVRVSGSVEVMPYLGIADAVLDVSETGATLESHGLKPIDVVLETSARIITPRRLDKQSRDVVDALVTLLRGYMAARSRRMVFLNVPGDKLGEVLSILPAMEGPMIARVYSRRGAEYYEVMSVVDEGELYMLIPKLKGLGIKDIVVVPTQYVIE